MDRRTFLKGASALGLVAILPATVDASIGTQQKTKTLKGKVFDLHIKKTRVNITGKSVIATTINDMLPAPTLVWQKGDIVTIRVTNHLDEPTSLHWHGIVLPFKMDGVPGVSFGGINPGETFVYRFKIKQTGTYWYHSHSGYQEQSGIHGAIVIDDHKRYKRDYVVALHDWSDQSPDSIYRTLKVSADYYNNHKRVASDFMKEVKKYGFIEASKRRSMWNKMRMDNRDIADVTGVTYTYMMNEHSSKNPARFIFKRGQKVRLRFINQSAMTYFDIRIPDLKMTVIAADGQLIKPVRVDDLRIAVAESYDVIVQPRRDTYVIYAESMDRSGFVYGYLSTNNTSTAPLPERYPYEELTMADMGMDMGAMKMGNMKSMDMSGNSNSMKMDDSMTMENSMKMSKSMKSSSDMKIGAMNMKHSSYKMSSSMDMSHSMKMKGKWEVTPLPKREDSIAWVMKAMAPKYRLDDPGVGLRSIAKRRKVLTYSMLQTPHIHNKHPDREIVMHLTGNMERYIWAINGIPYYESEPLEFKMGERLRVTFINDTMMNHPMHLHGMWSDVEVDGKIVRKHTVNVQPGSKVSLRINVDAPGKWVYHCHLLYHMGGMFREVKVI